MARINFNSSDQNKQAKAEKILSENSKNIQML